MPKLWAYVNHGILESQDKLNALINEVEWNKSTRIDKLLYFLLNLHSVGLKTADLASWLIYAQIMGIC